MLLEDGGRAEGECVDGLMQGTWLRMKPDGTRLERKYVDGKAICEKVPAPPPPAPAGGRTRLGDVLRGCVPRS